MPVRRPSAFVPVPLAACIALALAVGDAVATTPPHPHAHGVLQHPLVMQPRDEHAPNGTIAVTSCTDDGSGITLRDALEAATDGQVVDASALACSTITLEQGAIHIAANSVALHGPSNRVLTIDGGGADAVLVGYGTGTLAIDHVAIVDGRYDGAGTYANGGCIYFSGTVALDTVTMSNCSVGRPGVYGYGGAIFSAGGITVLASTLSDNFAQQIGGALFSYGDIKITDSTISGNASGSVGGGVSGTQHINVYSSTIAFNSAVYGGGGLFVGTTIAPIAYSTIIANNGYDATFSADIGSPNSQAVLSGGTIILSSDLPLPPDNIAEDPGLLPLANNGGLTMTHAIVSGSPAIDTGNNVAMLGYDQRGPGYTRGYGISIDIGAYERQPRADGIFADGFDPEM